MPEWRVVTVIIALVGLVATVAGPIVKLNGTLNKLSGKLALLLNNLEEFKGRYMQNLSELKEADRAMDKRLINHESRISKLEADHHTEG